MKWLVKKGDEYFVEALDNGKYYYDYESKQSAAYVFYDVECARRHAKAYAGRVVKLVPKRKRKRKRPDIVELAESFIVEHIELFKQLAEK